MLPILSILAVLAAGYAQPEPAHAPTLAPPIKVGDQMLAVPTPQQLAWHDREIGMFVHLAPQTWQDSESDKMNTPLSSINPDKLDTEQWARVAVSMGAKSIVFVAKHEGGFCWWPTATTDYSVKSIPWRAGKGDVLKDLSESCRKHDLKLGVYLSPQDRKQGVLIGGKTKDDSKQAEYERLYRGQLTEVLSNYGEISEVWFDGSLVFDVGDILAAHAPNAAVFQGPHATIRWVGNENGSVTYPGWNAVNSSKGTWGKFTEKDSDPHGDRWLPLECDARMRATWFWRTDNQKTLKSLERLVTMYEASVGRGAVLLLNNTPDRTGLIPEADALCAAEFGAEIERLYGRPAIDSSGTGTELVLTPSAPIEIDRFLAMEEIEKGERIRKFVVEGQLDSSEGAGTWKALAEGEAIGRKLIMHVSAERVRAVRLRVTSSVGEPIIRQFAVFAAEKPHE